MSDVQILTQQPRSVLAQFNPVNGSFYTFDELMKVFKAPLQNYEHKQHSWAVKAYFRNKVVYCQHGCGKFREHAHHHSNSAYEMRSFAVRNALTEDAEALYDLVDHVEKGGLIKQGDILASNLDLFYTHKIIRFLYLCAKCHNEWHDNQRKVGAIRRGLKKLSSPFRRLH